MAHCAPLSDRAQAKSLRDHKLTSEPVTLSLSQSVASAPTSTALPVSTKIQKKNAKKSEAKKEAKAVEEADRQRRLAMHRRDLER